MLRRIRMLTEGPNNNHEVGEILEVDADRAAVLVEGGYAEYADVPETAAVEAPEKAVLPRGKTRKVK